MNVFIKKNPLKDSSAIMCEVNGLKEIKKDFGERHHLNTPKIEYFDKEELKLEKIITSAPTLESSKTLGRELAHLHLVTNDSFGFYENNFIGLNQQINGWYEDWGEFFVTHRLHYQMELIQDQAIKDECLNWLLNNKVNLIDIFNSDSPKPSLVHGDLWSGNVLYTQHDAYVIDPAVYYADREVDLAMTYLFGGFTSDFYQSYREHYALSKRFDLRKSLYNLYHFLNHYNLFGPSYLGAIKEVLQLNIS